MAKQVINKGAPPIKWSDIDSAYDQINANFDELYLSLGGSGGAVDLTSLTTALIPNATATYDLGSASKRWRSLYLTGDSLYLGAAHITETGGVVNLPAGSTVGGELLIDPQFGAFRNISVSGQSTVVAETKEDSLTLAAGIGVSITTDAVTDSVTFTNVGVTAAIGSDGITVSGSITGGKGDVTFTNAGVVQAQAGKGISVNNGGRGTVTFVNEGIVGLEAGDGILLSPKDVNGFIQVTNSKPAVLANTFSQISVAGQTTLEAELVADTLTFAKGVGIDITTTPLTDTITIENTGVTSIAVSTGLSTTFTTGGVTLTNTGVTSLTAGAGISVSSTTGGITIASTGYGFTSFAVAGQNPIQADGTTDTFVFVPGVNVTLTTDPSTDALTISVLDLKGSNIHSDASTLLVDATNGKIVGDIETTSLRTSEDSIYLGFEAGSTSTSGYTVGIGFQAQKTNPDGYAVGVGSYAGKTNQGQAAVAIGSNSGEISQAISAVAIGVYAGNDGQGETAVAIGANAGATGQTVDAVAVGHLAGSASQGDSAVAIGWSSGSASQGNFAVAVGPQAGQISQGVRAVAIGHEAGYTGQGDGAIAIGTLAGQTNQADNSIIINASGTALDGAAAGLFIDPIREVTGPQSLYYDTSSKEVTWGPVPSSSGVSSTRTTVNNTTASLADAATGDLTIVGYKGYLLYKIQTSAAAWVRIYTDTASRLADAGRSELTDPTPGSGVIAEVITTGAETVLISPGVLGFSNESSPSANIEVAVTNKSGGTTTITVTLTVLQLEA